MKRKFNLKPGQLVVCIDDDPGVTRPEIIPEMHGLTKGRIYTVRWAGLHRMEAGQSFPGVRLVEIWRSPLSDGVVDLPFYARRFRPVEPKRLDVFTSMLEPAEVV